MTPCIIAHRGAPRLRHENTEAAVRAALAFAPDYVEIDVHLSRDGAVIVHHDADLKRSCGIDAVVEDETREFLRAQRLLFGSARSEPLAVLEDIARAARGVPLAIELKGSCRGHDEALTDAVLARRALLHRDSVLISFEAGIVARACAALPATHVGLIRNRDYGDDGWRDALRSTAGIAVLSKTIATESRVAALRDAGKQVWIYALDDDAEIAAGIACGASGIITNEPDRAAARLRERD